MKQFGPRETHQRTVRLWAFLGGVPPVVVKAANAYTDLIKRPRGHWVAACEGMPTGARFPLQCLLTSMERQS